MTSKRIFRKLLLNDSFITWLNNFMQDKEEIDDIYFVKENSHQLSNLDLIMIENLKMFYKELDIYFYQKTTLEECLYYFVKYKNNYYRLNFNGEGITCRKYVNEKILETIKQSNIFNMAKYLPVIEYTKLKRVYSLEARARANHVAITKLSDIFNELYDGDEEYFYQMICDFLSDDELNFILRNLENKSCETCQLCNETCKLTEDNKAILGIFDPSLDDDCLSWYNDAIIGKSKVLKITDVNKLK